MKKLITLFIISFTLNLFAVSDDFLNSWRGFRHRVDEFGGLSVEFGYSPTSEGMIFSAELNTKSFRPKTRNELIPQVLQDGIEIYVDGKKIPLVKNLKEGPIGSSYISIPLTRTGSTLTFEIKFLGKTIGKYEVDRTRQLPVKALQKAKLLSRFDLRMFADDKQKTPEGKSFLNEWIKKPRFVLTSGEAGQYFIDLHTHLAGALSTKSLLKIAKEFELPYPADLLDKLKIGYKEHRVYEQDGRKYLDYYAWQHPYLNAKFNIDPVETISFDEMSEMYQVRDPFVKNPKIFKRILEELAQDYERMGVKYVELSFYTIVRPEFYKIANEVLPLLEKRHGVKINFLVGLWRHSSSEANATAIRETKEAMAKCPYVVGVDFMGHETNPTTDFKEALTELSEMKKTFPEMVLRVHAGENANHKNNIIDAIRYGATRIGHGIYGVTPEAVQLAKENGVIIEFNFNSNLALQNVGGPNKLALAAKKYLDGGVKVTLGTDGHGLYMTTPSSEVATAQSVGFTERDLQKVWLSNFSYEKKMSRWVQSRQKQLSLEVSIPSSNKELIKSCKALF